MPTLITETKAFSVEGESYAQLLERVEEALASGKAMFEFSIRTYAGGNTSISVKTSTIIRVTWE